MTGWVRYWICDASGGGRNKWIYLHMPGYTDKESVRDAIIEVYESWAQFAMRYSLEIEMDVEPPIEEVRIAIDRYETLANAYGNIASELRASIGL